MKELLKNIARDVKIETDNDVVDIEEFYNLVGEVAAEIASQSKEDQKFGSVTIADIVMACEEICVE